MNCVVDGPDGRAHNFRPDIQNLDIARAVRQNRAKNDFVYVDMKQNYYLEHLSKG